MMRDQGPDVRSAVAAALGDLRDPRAVDPLIQALKDEHKTVRVAAAIALADIGDKRAATAISETIANEREEESRSQIKEALNRLNALPGQEK